MPKPSTLSKSRAGRPLGSRNAAGHQAGRPPTPQSDSYALRLRAWRTWWPARPRTLTLAVAGKRLEKTGTTLVRWSRTHEPPEPELGNLERLCAAYGYEPPTDDYKFP